MSDTASSDEELVEVDNYEEEAQDDDDEDDDDESISELDSWRQVHARLVDAVAIAREAVAAKKLQRRFWLEEICSNLTQEGKLTATSVWKRPVQPKKSATKKKAATPKKKKIKPEAKPKKRATEKKKKDTEDADDDEPKKKKIRLTLKRKPKSPSPPPEPIQEDVDDEETSEEEEDDDSEAGTNTEYQRDASGTHSTDYANAAHWGGGHHTGFLAGSTYGGSPESQYSPYAKQNDQFGGFYSGGLQAGLSNQEFYSTYSAGGAGPPGGAGNGYDESSEESDAF